MKNGDSSQNAEVVVKQFKTMLISALMLAFSIAILLILTSSKAWFSNNKTVTESGMSVKADVTPNLVITDDDAKLASISQFAYSVLCSKESGKEKMLACTRTANGLEYVTNPEVIAIRTGLVKSGANAPILKPITEAKDEEKDYFYVDYTVYIASHGKPLENMTLSAEIISADCAVSGGNLTETHKAATIEFYLGQVSSSNLKGTITVNDMATGKVTLFTGEDIPLCTEDGIEITMRCYFDGALTYTDESGGNIAFVNTYSVDTSGLEIDVRFSATETEE